MTLELRQIDLTVGHPLSFAVMFVDYFLGHAVEEELAISVDGPVAPIRAQGGGRRQGDGTYRFVDLEPGPYTVTFNVPSGYYRALTPPLTVTVPLIDTDLQRCVVQPLWPTPRNTPPFGMTAIRGRLDGASVGDLQVEIAAQPALPLLPSFSAFTRTDAGGEFLFLLPGPVTLDAGPGLAPLAIQVAGGARPVTETKVLSGTPTVFASASFQIPVARPARVLFQV